MKSFVQTSLLCATLLALIAPAQASESYTLDPMHTSVTWTINHFGFSNPWGKFSMIEGTLVLDEQNPNNSKLSVTVPVADLVTGIDKLDGHLKSKDFFDIANYPTATFVSTKITYHGSDATNHDAGGQTASVDGILTLHGISKPETLQVTLNKIGENMMKKKTAGFSATTTVKRSDFGMTTYLPMLGDDVKLYIEAEANL